MMENMRASTCCQWAIEPAAAVLVGAAVVGGAVATEESVVGAATTM